MKQYLDCCWYAKMKNLNSIMSCEIVKKKVTALDLLHTRVYSSVPNSRVGQNKRAGGKILKKH